MHTIDQVTEYVGGFSFSLFHLLSNLQIFPFRGHSPITLEMLIFQSFRFHYFWYDFLIWIGIIIVIIIIILSQMATCRT